MEPTGIVDLLTTTVPGRSTGAISRATPSTKERSAAPSSRLRRLHAEEDELGVARGRRRADDEAEPPGAQALGDERGQPLLEDRDLTLREGADAGVVDVGAHDVVPEVREARRGGEPDVPGTDDRDLAHACPLSAPA